MLLRQTNLERLAEKELDVLIVGCGINGAVSAAALSARGCNVGLIDRGDFAGVTSQSSSNLVWGGIKYLENFEFPLVWNLCGSRNRLMDAYPSTVEEVRFFCAVEPGFRFHPIFLYAGTWLYWAMGRGFTQVPRYLTKGRIRKEEPAINGDRFRGGVEYSDAYLHDNDARFVFSFVRLALNVGAAVANYVSLVSAEKTKTGWNCVVRDEVSGTESSVQTKILINSTGPFVDQLNETLEESSTHRLLFSRGIHLLVPKVTEQKRVLTFFDETGRMFFVIPMGNRSVIGTTDTRVDEPQTKVIDDDREFLLRNANMRLQLDKPLTRSDIIAERCGVRPLVVEKGNEKKDDGEWFALSRKHVIVDNERSISIYGGKLTDCLNVGEEICDLVEAKGITLEQEQGNWYGEPGPPIRKAFFRQAHLMRLDDLRVSKEHELLSTRLWRRYGLRAFAMLESIRRDPAMDDVLIEGSEYLRCELHHAAQTEMITKLEDFLRRRSKIALVLPDDKIRNAKGIHEACRMLFGDEAEQKYNEYFSADKNKE